MTTVCTDGRTMAADQLVSCDSQAPFDHDDRFEALMLMPDGTLTCWNNKGRSFVCEAPQAIGSGAAVAYGALDAGASPLDAVRIACKRDIFSGGDVDVLTLTP